MLSPEQFTKDLKNASFRRGMAAVSPAASFEEAEGYEPSELNVRRNLTMYGDDISKTPRFRAAQRAYGAQNTAVAGPVMVPARAQKQAMTEGMVQGMKLGRMPREDVQEARW